MKAFRLTYRRRLVKYFEHLLLVICLLGCSYQLHTCLVSYLQYDTITDYCFENVFQHRFPKFSICGGLGFIRKNNIKTSLTKLTLNETLDRFGELTDFVNRISITDGNTCQERVYETVSEIRKLAECTRKYLHVYSGCYLLDFYQTYMTSDHVLTREPVRKLNVYISHFKAAFQGNSINNEGFVVKTKLLKRAARIYKYTRLSKALLPYPYTNCIDAGKLGLSIESSFKAKCFEKALPYTIFNYIRSQLFLNSFSDERLSARHDLDEKFTAHCDLACNLNWCSEDNIAR